MKSFLRRVVDSFDYVAGNRYFSQLGEDAVLASYFQQRVDHKWGSFWNTPCVTKGYYIDIGAYSPKRLSNSYYFYRQGWHGITVEPNKEAEKWFRLLRPRDTHICAAITDEDKKLNYYSGGYSGVNFISDEEIKKTGFTRYEINGLTLKSLIAQYVPKATNIDFLSVDCEGHDLQVLKSNDWMLYRPSIVIAETTADSELTDFMVAQKYEVIAWVLGSVLYRRK